MSAYSFIVEKPCPVCGKYTRVIKTRSRLVVEKTDEDFCIHYKEFNPYFYKIWFCEHCGFAADEKYFLAHMPDRNRKTIMQFLSKRNLSMEFTEIRGIPEAVASFRLAIFFAEMINAPFSRRASLTLGLAWIYRFSGEEEKERDLMEKAAELYDKSIMTERYPVGNMTDSTAIYLVGAIHYRLGNREKAGHYLSRIIGNQDIRIQEPKTYDRAKYLWENIRAEKKTEAEKEKKTPEAPKKRAKR